MKVTKKIFTTTILTWVLLLTTFTIPCMAQEKAYTEVSTQKLGYVESNSLYVDQFGSDFSIIYLDHTNHKKRLFNYKLTNSKFKKITYKLPKYKKKKNIDAHFYAVRDSRLYSLTYTKNHKLNIIQSTKKGKTTKSTSVNLKKVMKKSVIKNFKVFKEYLTVADVVKVDANRIDILCGNPYSKKKLGGKTWSLIIRVNLKTGTCKKLYSLDFVPSEYDGKYIYWKENGYYKCKDLASEKMIYQVPCDYGVEDNKYVYDDTKSYIKGYSELPDHEYYSDLARPHSCKDGNLMFANEEGIFYVSSTDATPTKVMSYKDMPYYYNENDHYIYGLVMKNKDEFALLCTEDGGKCNNQLHASTYKAN